MVVGGGWRLLGYFLLSHIMATILLVDGHSILFAWKELRALQMNAGAAARATLLQMLGELHDSSDWHVVVVFDGQGGEIQTEKIPAGLQVVYSSSQRTADDVIERLVVKYADRHRIVVASDDHLERQVVMASGAEAISSKGLRDLIIAESRRFRRESWKHWRLPEG